MSKEVIHYYSLLSPWSYLGWPPVARVAERRGGSVRNRLVRLPKVFQANGGVPGGKKSPAQQRYRLMELERWGAFRGVPLNPRPSHHPFDDDLASRLVVAAEIAGHDADALAYRFMQGLWRDDLDLADPEVLDRLVAEMGLDPAALAQTAKSPEVEQQLASNTDEAIEAGVFGVPTYRIDDQLYWGQDRVEFVERHLTGRLHEPG